MRDDYGHEFQRWGVCRRCGCDHGDLKATDPCPGELPDLQTQPMPVVRPAVLPAGSQRGQPLTERPAPPPNGPSRRRRRIEDLALVDYVLRAVQANRELADWDSAFVAAIVVECMHAGEAPEEVLALVERADGGT